MFGLGSSLTFVSMRKLIEPTCRNLLRRPLVLGVPFVGLMTLSITVIGIQTLGQGTSLGNKTAIVVTLFGYIGLRVLTRFARPGWEEWIIFNIERLFQNSDRETPVQFLPSSFPILAVDTLDDSELLDTKAGLEERFQKLKKDEELRLMISMDESGAALQEIQISHNSNLIFGNLESLTENRASTNTHVYSLIDLPVVTDPLWLSSQLQKITYSFKVIAVVRGLDPSLVQAQIDSSRRRNAHTIGTSNVLHEVAFEEATRVLQGLARGDDTIVEFSMIIFSHQELNLDRRFFLFEKKPELALYSAFGLRRRSHRSLWIRAVTASDLVPNLLDPKENGFSVLKTPREKALFFDPLDSRLEALHWLLFGASGSGKSFFCGVLLSRMLRLQVPMSVFFIDHGRSFRQMVKRWGGIYHEPKSSTEILTHVGSVFSLLNQSRGLAGIELSDLTISEKKQATHYLLSQIETFLRTRNSTHPVYIVMDECWNFMRDEPVLVQRFFREFRKLNGAAIAITQSLSDLLLNESGQSIVQNAPIRIILRQGEDPSAYRGILNLNEIEISRLRRLRQDKGIFSECLIKTPFTSRLARLYPTPEEYELLRTDTIRQELIQEEMQRSTTCLR